MGREEHHKNVLGRAHNINFGGLGNQPTSQGRDYTSRDAGIAYNRALKTSRLANRYISFYNQKVRPFGIYHGYRPPQHRYIWGSQTTTWNWPHFPPGHGTNPYFTRPGPIPTGNLPLTHPKEMEALGYWPSRTAGLHRSHHDIYKPVPGHPGYLEHQKGGFTYFYKQGQLGRPWAVIPNWKLPLFNELPGGREWSNIPYRIPTAFNVLEKILRKLLPPRQPREDPPDDNDSTIYTPKGCFHFDVRKKTWIPCWKAKAQGRFISYKGQKDSGLRTGYPYRYSRRRKRFNHSLYRRRNTRTQRSFKRNYYRRSTFKVYGQRMDRWYR